MTAFIDKKKFTISDYYKMVEVGILDTSDKVELIYGEIIRMSLIKSSHASIVDRLNLELILSLQRTVVVRIQNPIRISNHSEPEPDLVIAKIKEGNYRNEHPKPEDILLLIEVADTTLQMDRKLKGNLYADAKIEEYWIVNIEDKQIEIYSQPLNKKYQSKQVVKLNEVASSTTIDFRIEVKSLFA